MNSDSRPAGLTVTQRALRCLALSMLIVYIGWQAYWLSWGQIPPSLFSSLTGWPSATTGGTRGLQALLGGRWLDSLHHNPCTTVFIALLLITGGVSLAQAVRHQRIDLPKPLVLAWAVTLSLAWAFKLLQNLFS